MRRVCLALLFAFLFCSVCVSDTAYAQGSESMATGLGRLPADKFPETRKAIQEIAASGAPRAFDVLNAALNGRLEISKSANAVFIRDTGGAVSDAATGEAAAAPPPDLKPLRLNNALRGLVQESIGGLQLRSPDSGLRLNAANSVFQSRDASKLSAIESAIENEQDEIIRTRLFEARAAIHLTAEGPNETDKLNAIEVLGARGDPDALNLLLGVPDNAPQAVKEAAVSRAAIIQSKLALWNVVQNLWYGMSLGSVLLLAAIGLAITFGVMGVINMAHGEMVMIGAYTTFVVQETIRASSMPWLFDFSLAIAIPTAFLVAGAIGVLIERGVIRFLYGRALDTLLATWGISLILQQAMRTIFGPTNQQVGTPAFMQGAFQIGELAITWNRLWIMVFALLVFAALLLVMKFTSLGLQMRAVTQNRRMASAMGIRTGYVDALTFGLGSGIAGLAGVALSQIDNVSPNLGQSYIIDSFLVVIFGGVGNLWGTLVGAMSLGVVNKLLEPYAGAVLGKIILIVAIIFYIQKRPRGLFALKGRAVEA